MVSLVLNQFRRVRGPPRSQDGRLVQCNQVPVGYATRWKARTCFGNLMVFTVIANDYDGIISGIRGRDSHAKIMNYTLW